MTFVVFQALLHVARLGYNSGVLTAGQFLRTHNFHLVMQHDCNLVIYNSDKFTPQNVIWSTKTETKLAKARTRS